MFIPYTPDRLLHMRTMRRYIYKFRRSFIQTKPKNLATRYFCKDECISDGRRYISELMEFQLFLTMCEDLEIQLWAKRQVLEDHGQQDSISERPKSHERGQKLIDFLFFTTVMSLCGR